MLKQSDNPPMFGFDGELTTLSTGGDDGSDAQWWVAHTKPRFEKTFAWDLRGRSIPYFLPMCERVRVSGGRKRRTLLPLFPSYMFFHGGEQARYSAMRTDRLVRVLPVTEPQQLVRELGAIERLVRGEMELDLYPDLPVGQAARVVAGSMQGTEGTIIERQDRKARLVLQVSMLGQGASVEVDIDLVEPIEVEPTPAGV